MVEVMISEGAGGRVRECERVVFYGKKNEKKRKTGANEWPAKR